MTTRFYLYESRHGNLTLTPVGKREWDYLVREMEEDNHFNFSDAEEWGVEIEGSFEEGWLFIDEGGRIREVELTELPSLDTTYKPMLD